MKVGTSASTRKRDGSLDGDPELAGTQQPLEAVIMIRYQVLSKLRPSIRKGWPFIAISSEVKDGPGPERQ